MSGFQADILAVTVVVVVFGLTVVVAVIVVVIAVVIVTVRTMVVVPDNLAVVFMAGVIPMARGHAPATVVALVVGLGPIAACIRGTAPGTGDPDVASAVNAPVSIDPNEAGSGPRPPTLIADGRRSLADGEAEADLSECGCG